jgi:galactose mutarotase-like enzyme
MPTKTKFNDFDVYTISSADGKTRASFVPEKGGVASSIIVPCAHTNDQGENAERELLFQHAYFWDRANKDLPGGFPFIFPICARIERDRVFGNYLYDGKLYNLSIHGFAAAMPWEVKNAKKDLITMSLRATKETLACYPFDFEIELQYQVSDKMLICKQHYINNGKKPMPYYAGFHPYFLTPPIAHGKEKVMLNFNAMRRLRYNERLTDIIGEQQALSLPASAADPAINEQLSELGKDKTISIAYPNGCKIYMRAEGVEDINLFRYVQIYTDPKEPFICVEPWMAYPNAMNAISGVRWVAPNSSEQGILRLWIE